LVVTEHIVAGVIVLFVGSLFLLMSYVAGVCKHFSMIAGMDETKIRDRDGLARLLGKGLVIIGMLQLLIGLALLTTSVSAPLLIVAAVVVHLTGLVVVAIRSQRYLG
jgi:hypothetical protein